MSEEYVRKSIIIILMIGIFTMVCKKNDTIVYSPEVEKLKAAYAYLLTELHNQNIHVIALQDDENPEIVREIITALGLNLEVERVVDLEKRSDLCYYSRITGRLITVIGVDKRDGDKYYVSYYIGPEGGGSKVIELIKRKGEWFVANDDGRWVVK